MACFWTTNHIIDIKLNNFLFCGIDDARIDAELLKEDVIIEGEYDVNGETYPICASQPIPHPFAWNTDPHHAELMIVKVADLGQGGSIISLRAAIHN